jgi:hypothetical protein
MRTYFRSKEKLSPEALDALEKALVEIRAEFAPPPTDNHTTGSTTGGTP